jgi:hypothetical protein
MIYARFEKNKINRGIWGWYSAGPEQRIAACRAVSVEEAGG